MRNEELNMFEDHSSLIAEINCITTIRCFIVYFQFPGKIKKIILFILSFNLPT